MLEYVKEAIIHGAGTFVADKIKEWVENNVDANIVRNGVQVLSNFLGFC